jgi:hypothetical protein
MQSWKRALREGLVTGAAASVASTVALAICGRRESGNAAAPVNAVSHWVWDREALSANAPSVRHTLTGYLVHHGASIFWATLHARVWGMHEHNKRPLRALAGGAVASAVACFVDYRLTPERLTPGFEHRLSKTSMSAVYACFGLGLAVGSMALTRRSAPSRPPREERLPPPTPAH